MFSKPGEGFRFVSVYGCSITFLLKIFALRDGAINYFKGSINVQVSYKFYYPKHIIHWYARFSHLRKFIIIGLLSDVHSSFLYNYIKLPSYYFYDRKQLYGLKSSAKTNMNIIFAILIPTLII